MDRVHWLLAFVLLTVAAAYGQRSTGQSPIRQDTGCEVVDLWNGPYQCPNGSSCGTYNTVSGEACNIDNGADCVVLVPTSFCCGRYHIPLPQDACLITEAKDPHARSRLLELAEENDILVPTCSGAYVPAGIALREHKGKDNGGL